MPDNKLGAIRRTVDNTYVFWALLAGPAIYLLAQRFALHGRVPYVPLSGDIACWILIVTLAVTPLMQLFGPLPWVKARLGFGGVSRRGVQILRSDYHSHRHHDHDRGP